MVFFELMGKSAADAEGYQFVSVEVKQSAFRLDGVLLPPVTTPDVPAYVVSARSAALPTTLGRDFD